MHHHPLRSRFLALHDSLVAIADDVKHAIAQLDAIRRSDAAVQTADQVSDSLQTWSSETDHVLLVTPILSRPASSVGSHQDHLSLDPSNSRSSLFSKRSMTPLTSIKLNPSTGDNSLSNESPTLHAHSSRYATPSESGSQPIQERDEDEVWRALVLDARTSGLSTPLSDLPMMLSHPPSRASSVVHPHPLQQELLSVDPSILHDPPPDDAQGARSPLFSQRSLSPLTSVPDTPDVDSTLMRPGTGMRHNGIDAGDARSRALGGPDASPDELARLARRAPSKISLYMPGTKRKRDNDCNQGGQHEPVDARDEAQAGQENAMSFGVGHLGGSSVPAPEAGRHVPMDGSIIGSLGVVAVGQLHVAAPPERRKHRKGNDSASVLSSHIEATRTPVSISTSSQPVKHSTSNGVSDSPSKRSDVPRPYRQRTKRHKHPRVQRGKPPRALEGTAESASGNQYCIQNGKIVAVPLEQERPSRYRKGRESGAIDLEALSSTPKKEVWQGARGWGAGTWPVLGGAFGQWDGQFIQCDSCEMWYHYGCVAIASGDPRLESGVTFICPACQIGSGHMEDRGDTCGRPDCPELDRVADAEHFFVERLVGRKKIGEGIYMWLAKWEGYPMSQATWIPKENVVGDGRKLFDAFVEDAIGEGVDVREDVVLLGEARDAGWGA